MKANFTYRIASPWVTRGTVYVGRTILHIDLSCTYAVILRSVGENFFRAFLLLQWMPLLIHRTSWLFSYYLLCWGHL